LGVDGGHEGLRSVVVSSSGDESPMKKQSLKERLAQ